MNGTACVVRIARVQRRWASTSRHPRPPKPAPATRPPPVGRAYKPRNATQPEPSPEPPTEQTLLSVWRSTWLPLTGAALLAGGLGFYIVGTAAASLKPCPCGDHESPAAVPTGRPPALTGDNAEQFDRELNLPEWWMGITKLRRRIAEHAHGNVLELAMGTGRNMEYYNWEPLSLAVEALRAGATRKAKATSAGVTSFTGLDISVDMLEVARKRLVKAVPPLSSFAPVVKASAMADHTGGQLSFLNGHVRLIHSDAHHALPQPPVAESKYDTIVQSFGLCSVSDPVAVLENLASAVKPETGRIILLEHGMGWYGVVNGLLDRNANKHFDKYGCWWNRDIEALVDEAVAKTPGLEVVKLERPNMLQMGTLVWVELKMRAGN